MEKATITFSAENMLTIFLMVFIMTTAFGIIAKLISKSKAGTDA